MAMVPQEMGRAVNVKDVTNWAPHVLCTSQVIPVAAREAGIRNGIEVRYTTVYLIALPAVQHWRSCPA